MASSDDKKLSSADITLSSDFSSSDLFMWIDDPGGSAETKSGELGKAIPIFVLDTAGDILYVDSDGAMAGLALGTALQVLRVDSDTNLPEWGTFNELQDHLNMNDKQAYGSGQAVSYSTDITIDLDAGVICTLTLTDSPTTIGFTNIRAYTTCLLQVTQDGTGGRTITWDTEVTWPAGTAPTLTTDANAVDIITFAAFDSDTLRGASQLNYS